MAQAIVIGAGVAGLSASLALARSGHEVTLVERDEGRLPPTVDAAFERWDRWGVPQARHSHAFLARLRNLLRDRAPDLLDALLSAGVTEMRFTERLPAEMEDQSPREGDEDLVALACRRTTFEWVFRRCLLEEPGVRLLDGVTVESLETRAGDPPTVTGIRGRRTDGSTVELAADLVVDASGRRSPLARWLTDAGVQPPEEETVECGIVYLSRFYRLRDGVDFPPQEAPIGGDLGYVKYAVFLGDNRTFSVTLGTATNEATMRPRLLKADLFDLATANLPATTAWVDRERSEPITGVEVMARLLNRRRSLVADGEPIIHGLHAIGDALIHTNPLYGRGCSLGMVHAYLLSDLLADHADDPRGLALALDEATRREIEPWYRASVTQDIENQRAASGEVATDDPMRSLMRDGLMPAVRTDPEVFRAFLRVLNLLTAPDAIIGDPEIVGRVLTVWQARGERPDPPAEGPTQDEMLRILDGDAA
jgi:2-polyprenyl-6-methoxyphenol hydroxylase-like FAD-dependent oxidoreductase